MLFLTPNQQCQSSTPLHLQGGLLSHSAKAKALKAVILDQQILKSTITSFNDHCYFRIAVLQYFYVVNGACAVAILFIHINTIFNCSTFSGHITQ